MCFDLCVDYVNEVVVCLCRTHVDDTEAARLSSEHTQRRSNSAVNLCHVLRCIRCTDPRRLSSLWLSYQSAAGWHEGRSLCHLHLMTNRCHHQEPQYLNLLDVRIIIFSLSCVLRVLVCLWILDFVIYFILFIYLLYFLIFLCPVCCVFWCVSRFLALLFEIFSFLSALCSGVWSPDVSVKYVNITQSDESLLICSLNSNAAS